MNKQPTKLSCNNVRARQGFYASMEPLYIYRLLFERWAAID